MTASCGDGAVGVLVDHVDRAGRSRAAVRAARRWGQTDVVLSGFASPAVAAAACRAATGAAQDRLLCALLAVSPGDEWAQLTILAGLARRLAWVVSGWVGAGVAAVEVADMEAELVAACWQAIIAWGDGPPGRPGLVLVDRAWDRVRVARRRRRRRDDRQTVLPDRLPAAAQDRPALEVLATEVTAAVSGGRLGLRAARTVYLTRVAGYSTAETGVVLGCDPRVVRVLRCRAERRLAA